jgi:hypothetical protein
MSSTIKTHHESFVDYLELGQELASFSGFVLAMSYFNTVE